MRVYTHRHSSSSSSSPANGGERERRRERDQSDSVRVHAQCIFIFSFVFLSLSSIAGISSRSTRLLPVELPIGRNNHSVLSSLSQTRANDARRSERASEYYIVAIFSPSSNLSALIIQREIFERT